MAISRFCAVWGCCNPRKNGPFGWTSALGQGRAPRGVTWAGAVWPEGSPPSPLRRRLEDALPKSPGRGKHHTAPQPRFCSQTCCLLWVGLLQVVPCLEAKRVKEKFCYLVSPMAGGRVGSYHTDPVAALGVGDGWDVLLRCK